MHDTKLQIEEPPEQIGQPKSMKYNPSLNEPLIMWRTSMQCGLRPYTNFTQAWEAQQKWEILQLTKNEQ